MKLSKQAKGRLKRSTIGERKQLIKAARLLADFECISNARYVAIMRTSGLNDPRYN